MATNYLQEGRYLTLPVSSGKVSGDWDMVGKLPVVLLTDRDSDGNAECDTHGVYDLDVSGFNNTTAGTAVTVGAKIYADGTQLNVDSTNGVEFGLALEAIDAAGSDTINVRLKGC